MRSFRSVLTLVFAIGMSAGSAGATTCSSDVVPAATLLFPFVVFDYDNPIIGDTSLVTIINTAPAAQIVHVTLWSDAGAPLFDFNIVLSGYDMQRINLRDLLYFGTLPDTGTAGPLVVSGSAAAAGPVVPTVDLALPESTAVLLERCSPSSPQYPDYPPIPQAILEQLQYLLQASQRVERSHNDCVSPANYTIGDWFENRTTADPTWMWVTADVVWTCTGLFPDAAEYWQDGPTQNPGHSPTGAQRMTDNVLVGEAFWVNEEVPYFESAAAVHVEADRSLGDNLVTSSVLNPSSGLPQSFYHKYASPHGLSDLRLAAVVLPQVRLAAPPLRPARAVADRLGLQLPWIPGRRFRYLATGLEGADPRPRPGHHRVEHGGARLPRLHLLRLG
jgi:hypothetical protein